jgi:hypothetical protein
MEKIPVKSQTYIKALAHQLRTGANVLFITGAGYGFFCIFFELLLVFRLQVALHPIEERKMLFGQNL